MTNQTTNYGGKTTVYFSAASLKSTMSLYSIHSAIEKAKKANDIVVSFYRTVQDPDHVVPALAAGTMKGALRTKKDIKSSEAYAQPVAVATKADLASFGANKEVLELVTSFTTVEEVREYFPNPLNRKNYI